jgi:glycosyltransferase involved in cell wall biosynthesis
MLTAVIPFWNGNDTLPALLKSIPGGTQIIIVQDKDSEPPDLTDLPDAIVVEMKKRGYFAGSVNEGIRASSPASDILVLNQDVYFTDPKQIDVLIRTQAPVYDLFGEGVMDHPAFEKGYVQGTFMYMSRKAINHVGLFNAEEYPHWGTTCEWQMRVARAGFKVNPLPKIPGMVHDRKGPFGSATRRSVTEENFDYLIRSMPELSVVVPCYKTGRYLPDLIHSLIGGETSLGEFPPQSFQGFEVILVDDGSNDDTTEMIKYYSDPLKGIRGVILETNQGTPAAVNAGIRASHGRYITVMGSDDMREPWALKEMLLLAKVDPHRVIYDDVFLFANGKKYKEWKLQDYDFDQIIHKNHMHAGIMFHRKAWEQTGGYPEIMKAGREDWAFNVALGLKGFCGYHLSKPGYLYRREGQNRTETNTTPEWMAVFRKQMTTLYPELYKGIRPMGCCGGKSTVQRVLTDSLNGMDGMVKITFLHDTAGTQNYIGPVSKMTYKFGGQYKERYVDQRDLVTKDYRNPGLLELVQFGRPVFGLSKVEPATQPIIIESEAVIEEPQEEKPKRKRTKSA